jgi:Trk K+ transport system NAD-binding subunit
VVFANVDRAVMDKEIETRCGDLGKLRVITRKGDTTNPADLKRANVAGAKSVIVLDSDRVGDAMVISTVLAAKSLSKNSNQRFVAEMDDKNVADALTSATNGEVVAVIPRDIIARVTAQASRQPGIPAVILELLDFDGDEIYFQEVPDLVGKSYFEAQQSFRNASLIGLVPNGGLPILNPAWNHKIAKGDKVMAIAKDDDQVLFSIPEAAPKRPKSKALAKQVRPAKSMLVVGWSNLGREVLNALAAYLPKGSSADIVLQRRFTELNMNWDTKFGELKTRFVEADGSFDQLRELVLTRKYDEVLVLGYRGEEISEAEADGQTLLATMQLTRLFENEMYRGHAPRLVAEILDPLKVGLAKTASIDDVVVSENLAALLIAQLSENPLLANTFADLFDPSKGSAVQVQPFSNYVKLGEAVSFAELVAMASSQGESAIGWRASAIDGEPRKVIVNPGKDQLITPIEGDGLIVIGPSI